MVYDALIHLDGILRDGTFYKPKFNFRINFGYFCFFMYLYSIIEKWKIGRLEELFRREMRMLFICP